MVPKSPLVNHKCFVSTGMQRKELYTITVHTFPLSQLYFDGLVLKQDLVFRQTSYW